MTTTTYTDTTPRAWVGCLACYNAGTLRGAWLDLDGLENPDTLAAICTNPTHEELWVMDTDNLPGGEMSPDEAAKTAREVQRVMDSAEEYGVPWEVAYEYCRDLHTDPMSWPTIGYDVTVTSADSETDYAAEIIENVYELDLPSWLHIDYASTFRDLTSGQPVYTHDGTLYIFSE